MPKSDQLQQYAALGLPSQNRKRETSVYGPCAHMDASGVTEQARFWRRRRPAKDQSPVRPPQLAASSFVPVAA
jgi:hypothetical protein